MGVYSERMRVKLMQAFQPLDLNITDDSSRHAGHMGENPDGGGETHFNVSMVSEAFTGKSRVDRQRLVHAVLADELSERVHALSLKLTAPSEVKA
jgi:BolA family transcriptional regulator, general stress-responsive regulator